jgi:uncharacterized cupin superfamily protein
MKQILNLADAPLEPLNSPNGRFCAEFASLTSLIGSKKLGVSLAVVPPGSRAWPCHAHHVNEEMMLILEGEGTFHCGDQSAPVTAGDLIAAPAGDASTAHQIENTSDNPLRYLTFSTRLEPEIVEYPDSGKFAVASWLGGSERVIGFIGRPETSLGYYDGEE